MATLPGVQAVGRRLPTVLESRSGWALRAGARAAHEPVADWFVMTDELLYERLALSVDRTHSPLPHVHGEMVSNINQLYPLVIAPVVPARRGRCTASTRRTS